MLYDSSVSACRTNFLKNFLEPQSLFPITTIRGSVRFAYTETEVRVSPSTPLLYQQAPQSLLSCIDIQGDMNSFKIFHSARTWIFGKKIWTGQEDDSLRVPQRVALNPYPI